MTSLILRTATRFMLPLLLLFSLFLLLRGHHKPGGGFSGGLVAAAAVVLYAMAFGVPAAREAMRVNPRTLMGVGLLVAIAAGCLGPLTGRPFLTGRWLPPVPLPDEGVLELGTPLLFDFGVYLLVAGMTLTIVLALAEE